VTNAPNSQHGKELAARLCSNCHLVGNAEQQQANADVPSFHEIGNKEGQSAGAIMERIMLPRHPMPTIPLTKSELADLSAYILSLREEK
jgi:mono/diheme cytochrome c family protein